jgi:hypothetical protein
MTTPFTETRASTARHFQVLVSIDGESLGVFDTRSGGGTTAEVTKHTPGSSPNMRAALGGPRDTEDVTVGRSYVYDRDLFLSKKYIGKVGQSVVTVTQTPLDKDGRLLMGSADSMSWTGILSNVTPPEYDASGTDVATWELTMVCDGPA